MKGKQSEREENKMNENHDEYRKESGVGHSRLLVFPACLLVDTSVESI